MIYFSEQDKRDVVMMITVMGLYLMLMLAFSFLLSRSLDINFDSSRPLVGSAFTVIILSFLVRDIVLYHWKAYLGLVSFVLLAGSYGAASELYIKHLTLLGMGELPQVFPWIYLSLVFASMSVTCWEVKKVFVG